MDFPKLLHNNLRYLRKRTKLTIAELLKAIDLDIPVNTFASYEDNRENTPKYDIIKQLLHFYNKELATNITYEDLHEKDIEAIGFSAFEKTNQDKIQIKNNAFTYYNNALTFEQNIAWINIINEYENTLLQKLEAENAVKLKMLEKDLKKLDL